MEKKLPLKIVFRLPKPQQQQPTSTTDQTKCSSCHSKKRKSSSKNDATAAKRKICIKKPAESKNLEWGYSTDLMLYDDPWKIKKTLTVTDLGGRWLRLLVPADMAKSLILPVLGVETDDESLAKEGFQVRIWDVNTEYEYELNFKLWNSSGGYIFSLTKGWMEHFVIRRELKLADEIGFPWDPYKDRFDFAVLRRAATMKEHFKKNDFLHSSEMIEWGSWLTL